MRKILIYFSFAAASLVVVMVFMTAATYGHLAVAVLLYFLLAYFAFRVFPRKNRKVPSEKPVIAIQPQVESAETFEPAKEPAKRENVGIADIDKRAFLKLVGGVGLSLFLFSIFNRKAEAVLFQGLPGSGSVSLADITGNKINPAQSQPTDGYKVSEIDNDIITFYGFINKNGAWYIMSEDTDTGSFRYSRGDSNFSGNWANRKHLKYDYFNNVFQP